MKAILLKHCTLVSMNPKENKIQNNIDILIREGKISKIASGINNNGAETIDCNDKVIIPGMINCHTHIPMSLFRELVDGYSLQD
jgi:5-methylthioadenosine/S-adenosylhomocysteine deaminase